MDPALDIDHAWWKEMNEVYDGTNVPGRCLGTGTPAHGRSTASCITPDSDGRVVTNHAGTVMRALAAPQGKNWPVVKGTYDCPGSASARLSWVTSGTNCATRGGFLAHAKLMMSETEMVLIGKTCISRCIWIYNKYVVYFKWCDYLYDFSPCPNFDDEFTMKKIRNTEKRLYQTF